MGNFDFFGFFTKKDIPVLFYDTLNQQPFETCSICNKPLLLAQVDYLIEKAFRKNPLTGKMDIILEYAICWDCALETTSRYSKKSRHNLEMYFMKNVNLHERANQFQKMNFDEIWDTMLSQCAVKNLHISELDEYQIIGQFTGNKMSFEMPPYLLSGLAIDEMSDLLSNQTLDELDDFTGKYLTGPPEISNFIKAPKRTPVLI